MNATVIHNLDALNKILPEYLAVSGYTTSAVLVKKGYDLSRRISDKLRLLKPGKGTVTADRIAALKGGGGIRIRSSIIKSTVAKYGGFVRLQDRQKHTQSKFSTASGVGGILKKRGVKGLRLRSSGRNPEGVTKVKSGGKKLNIWQLIVQRELKARESGAGYTAWAAMMDVRKVATNKIVKQFGRVRQELGRVGLSASNTEAELRFQWGGVGHDGQPIQSGESLSKPRQQAAIATAIADSIADIKVYLARKHGEALEQSISSAITKTPMKRI